MGRATDGTAPPPVVEDARPPERYCSAQPARPMTAQRPLPTAALTEAARALRLSFVLHGLARWAALSAAVCSRSCCSINCSVCRRRCGCLSWSCWRVMSWSIFTGASGGRPGSRSRRRAPRGCSRSTAASRDNLLINAHQFESATERSARRGVRRPDHRLVRLGARQHPDSLALADAPLRNWFFGAIAIAVCWLLLVFAFPRYVATGMQRILLPLSDIPPDGPLVDHRHARLARAA